MPVHSIQNDRASALTEKPAEEHVPVLSNNQTNGENSSQHADNGTTSGSSQDNKAAGHLALARDDNDSILPTPDITNLYNIKEILLAVRADEQVQKEMNRYIVEEEYIEKFIPVLETCERMELSSKLYTLHSILMHLIDVADASIMDQIVRDSTFESCLRILENEPGSEKKKPRYRRAFSRQSKIKQVIPIEDPYTLGLIHQVSRLRFLKEYVLFPKPDDLTGFEPDDAIPSGATKSMLKRMIRSKSLEIVQDIAYDRNFMDDLFEILTNEAEPMHRRQDVVFFVYQLCTMAKNTRANIYKKLDPFDFMRLLEFAAGASNTRVKQTGVEILQMALEANPNFIRNHIARRPSTNNFKAFFDSIINQSLAEANAGIMPHFTVAIRTLLDIKDELRDEDDESLPSDRVTSAKSSLDQASKDEKFLDVFYEQFFSSLSAPLLQLTGACTALNRITSARCESACLLLSSIAQFYPERLKPYLASSRLAEKICLLFKNEAKHMRFAALQFFRACLEHDDKCFNQMLIKNKVIHGLLPVLQDTKGSKSVLNSACINFFECIRKNNIKLLVSHCATTHKETIKSFNCIPVFKDLMALHAGENDSGTAGQAFQAMLTVRLRNIPPDHLRPFFDPEDTDETDQTTGDAGETAEIAEDTDSTDDADTNMDTDEHRIAKRKREDDDDTEHIEEMARMRPRQKCSVEENISNENANNSGAVEQ
ncbi:Platinum sensitivity protein [Mortierella sp. 14UC]|nr:Platinum sensitivity protein [Mortierella sp. 14UC]